MPSIKNIKKLIHLSLAALLILTLQPPLRANSGSCQDLYIVFARGSGDVLNGENYRAFKSAINSELAGSRVKYTFYELGTHSQNGHQYPATDISINTASGTINSLGAIVSGGQSFAFGRSVKEGISELTAFINNTAKSCQNTKFALGGYSQGAMVISGALPSIHPEKIVYAATYGDPKLYLPEGAGKNPRACRDSSSYSDYRAYVPDCHAYEGILGGQKPYVPTSHYWQGKVGAWCNYQDVMCSRKIDPNHPIAAHLAYISDHRYVESATAIADQIKLQITHESIPERVKSTRDVAFIIDSSNANEVLLAKYSESARAAAKVVLDRGGRLALYDLRPGTTRELCSFDECSYQRFSDSLGNITVSSSQSSLYDAFYTTMNGQVWTLSTNKQIVAFTNSGIYMAGISPSEVITRSRQIDPVHLNIVTDASLQDNPEITALVSATGGKVYDIDDENSTLTQDLAALEPEGSVFQDPTPLVTPVINEQSAEVFSDNSVHISYSADSATNLLVIDGAIYGFTTLHDFTISDLDLNEEHSITLVPFAQNGDRGEPATVFVGQKSPAPDNTKKLGAPATGFHTKR